ncbi:choloylglycine hydrolase [Microbacterium ginsengiterrae]|uniref:Choloylglycine hydrolase n=2 Tax=Microbacterium ginsengiterrae TaxID=546115 RepID=A0A7W9FE53_9MICO|nr:choloylglycine hydrolase [Microbacterium ginsengiterrae]
MDFHMDLLTNLWKLPRGIERSDGANNTLTWKAKYGSVVATAFDLIATDGMNEEGFAGHILWLAESDYGKPDADAVQLSQAIWLQYYLDNFATVAEAVEWTESSQVQIAQLFDPTGHLVPTLHLAIDDATGDSAIIEYTDGKPKVYHGREYQVMTNSPTFDKQLELVKEIDGLGGDKPLPGSTLASDRFARASYYVARQVQPKTQIDAIAAMFSIIRNAAQPFRTPEPGKPDASQTIWQVVLDLTNKRYAFESTTRPNIVWVDFDELGFEEGTKVQKLNLLGRLALEGGLAGNVSAEFTDESKLIGGLRAAGVDALEWVAREQDEFAAVKKAVQRLVGHKKKAE